MKCDNKPVTEISTSFSVVISNDEQTDDQQEWEDGCGKKTALNAVGTGAGGDTYEGGTECATHITTKGEEGKKGCATSWDAG